MMRNVFLFFLLFPIKIYSQNDDYIKYSKDKFFQYPVIGVDSALYYTDKVFASKKKIDIAFALAAKRQLLELKKIKYNDKEYLEKIRRLLSIKILTNKKNYYDLANIYNIKGNTFKLKNNLRLSLEEFIIAEKFALKHNDIQQILKIKGNLATIKGELNLINQAIHDFRSILKIINENKTEDKREYFNLLSNNTNLNLGVYYIEKYKTQKKSINIDSASYYLNSIKLSNSSDELKGKVFAKKGILNFERRKYNLANQNFLKSIFFFEKLGLKQENENNFYNLALSYYSQKDLENSKKYFFKVIKDGKKDNNYNYLFSLKHLSSIYSIQKKDSSRIYLDKFIDLYEKEGEIEKKEIAASYNIIERKKLNQEIHNLKETKKKNYFIFSALLLSVTFIFFLSKMNYKNKIKNEVNKLVLEISSQKTNRKQVAINNENSLKILEGLKKLEDEKYFLSKNFNLYNVSKKIGTNTTYLSKIVQEHKNLSFNDYTNELRINFILNEFKTNKKIHNFTTQSLAEHIGYKNGDSFTKIFKEKTGITPYKFIKEYKFENF